MLVLRVYACVLQEVQRDAVCVDVSVPEVAVQRMKLDERRIDTLIQGIQQVASTEDPIGKTLGRTEIARVLPASLSSVHCSVSGPECSSNTVRPN